MIFISQGTFICENSSSKDFLSSYLYNEIGRNKTSHELRETFWGKFSQVTDRSLIASREQSRLVCQRTNKAIATTRQAENP